MSGDDKNIKILFFGDIVGKPGRNAVKYFMENFPDENKPDFVVANVENASHGFGLTEKNYNELSSYGIDCMTSGNHIWDKKDIFNYIDSAEKLLRPMNYPECIPGKGSGIFTCKDYKIGVINLLGRVFMNLVDDPFKIVEQEIKRLKEITPIILVDFHAEATAEKICLGKFCAQMGVSGFLGTHTHIQTADEKVLNGMGYITDAGFCGTSDGVIGMEYTTSLNRFLKGIPERYEVADGGAVQINAVELVLNPITGATASIKRIFSSIEEIEKDKSQ